MAYGQTDRSSPAVDSDALVGDSGMTMAQLREVEEAREKSETLEYYEKIAFDPVRAGLLAISALAEIEAEPEERAGVFEELLSETKELGLRNSLRMVLNEIYIDAGATDDVVENLSAMLAENDAMLAEGAEDDEDADVDADDAAADDDGQ